MRNMEDIGVIGSPSTNIELTVDLLQEAAEERVVGALVGLEATQNGDPIKCVGQIISVELRNRWHEDSVFRNLIKRTGEIPPITNRQDTRTAALVVGATFSEHNEGTQRQYDPDVLGMVPPTGTRVFRVSQGILDELLSAFQSEIFYLGRAYANDVYYPMWFKHFGSGVGGAGEAYHLGIFGKTGSGKSVLAKNILLAYGQHKQMGLLVFDPQGEFAREFQEGQTVGRFQLPYRDVIQSLGRDVRVITVPQIRLDRWELFSTLLARTTFFLRLTIRSSNYIENASNVLEERLRTEKIKLTDLHQRSTFDRAIELLGEENTLRQIYSGAEPQKRLQEMLNKPEVTAPLYEGAWLPIARLFRDEDENGRRPTAESLLETAMSGTPRPLIIIDLSGKGLQDFWSEEVQALLLSRLVEGLVSKAEERFGGEPLNALVVLDEAHRLVTAETLNREDEQSALRRRLIDGVRTTRKYGLGWMFISQSLSSIHRAILDQLRIMIFGFGLAQGDEFRRLRDFAGGDERSMELYQSFRDPQSFPRRDLQVFPFMAVGPVSPLAFSGRPLFFSAFTDPQELISVNGLLLQTKPVMDETNE